MSITIEQGNRDDAFAVRRAVFMEEQGYENEFEPLDDVPECIHVTAYVDGELAGCARTFPEPLEHAFAPDAPHAPASALDANVTPQEIYLLGRVAVMPAFRRQGLASTLAREAARLVAAAGARVMKLHGQVYVQGMYAKLGYEPIAPVDYEDEGHPHVCMAKRFDGASE